MINKLKSYKEVYIRYVAWATNMNTGLSISLQSVSFISNNYLEKKKEAKSAIWEPFRTQEMFGQQTWLNINEWNHWSVGRAFCRMKGQAVRAWSWNTSTAVSPLIRLTCPIYPDALLESFRSPDSPSAASASQKPN